MMLESPTPSTPPATGGNPALWIIGGVIGAFICVTTCASLFFFLALTASAPEDSGEPLALFTTATPRPPTATAPIPPPTISGTLTSIPELLQATLKPTAATGNTATPLPTFTLPPTRTATLIPSATLSRTPTITKTPYTPPPPLPTLPKETPGVLTANFLGTGPFTFGVNDNVKYHFRHSVNVEFQAIKYLNVYLIPNNPAIAGVSTLRFTYWHKSSFTSRSLTLNWGENQISNPFDYVRPDGSLYADVLNIGRLPVIVEDVRLSLVIVKADGTEIMYGAAP